MSLSLQRPLVADPAIANTRVVFSTAHPLEREASSLASACGVSFTLYRPGDPEIVLRTVDSYSGARLDTPRWIAYGR